MGPSPANTPNSIVTDRWSSNHRLGKLTDRMRACLALVGPAFGQPVDKLFCKCAS